MSFYENKQYIHRKTDGDKSIAALHKEILMVIENKKQYEIFSSHDIKLNEIENVYNKLNKAIKENEYNNRIQIDQTMDEYIMLGLPAQYAFTYGVENAVKELKDKLAES